MFVNYHKHSHYTNPLVPDSMVTPEEYVHRILELNQKVLSTVEHGYCGNVIEYYELAQKYNLKLLIGTETYFIDDRTERNKDIAHLVLLAKNEKGRRAINVALSEANLTGFFNARARMDWELIEAIPKDDVWVTSACIGGLLKRVDYKDTVLRFYEHFGNNFYLELQHHNHPLQKEVNKHALELHDEFGIPLIVGLDSHYIYPEQKEYRSVYLISRRAQYGDEDIFDLDYPDEETLKERFKVQSVLPDNIVEEAIKNTYVMNEVEPYTGTIFSKDIKMPEALKYKGKSHEEKMQILRKIIYENFEQYKSKISESDIPKYEEEIEKNLKVVEETNHADYFLLNYEICNLGRVMGAMISPSARGSVSGFLIAKFLNFTKLDKMKSPVPLYAERFITKERILESGSLADIDMNVGNQEIMEEAQTTIVGYGNAYPLVTYGTMSNKGAWKMYARAKNLDYKIANEISYMLDEYIKDTKHNADVDPDNPPKVEDYIPKNLMDYFLESKKYLNIVNNMGVHACGYLVYTDGDIKEEFGLIRLPKTKNPCVCADGYWIEKYHFMKNDLLKVHVSALIYKVFDRILGYLPDLEEIVEMADKCNAWDIYQKGITAGLSQFDTDSSTQKVLRYKPKNIMEVSAFIAAIRPAFKTCYADFESRIHMSYGVDAIDNMLKPSQGWLLYQENIMQMLSYAGFEIAETYTILKAIAKKRPEEVLSTQERFKHGMIDRLVKEENIPLEKAEDVTDRVWKVIEDSCSYAFNSAHAMAYAYDSLYCAVAKKLNPLYFYEVYINLLAEIGNKLKILKVKNEAEKFFKIKFPLPKFGEDNRQCTANPDTNSISFSLIGIKEFTEETAESLYTLGQEFEGNFYELLLKSKDRDIKIGTKQIEKLIQVGYFEKFGSVDSLLKIYNVFIQMSGRKMFSTDTLDKLPVIEELVYKFCDKKTSKRLSEFREKDFFEFLIVRVNNNETPLHRRLLNEQRILGEPYATDPNAADNLYFVTDLTINSGDYLVNAYHPKDRRFDLMKIKGDVLRMNQVDIGDLIYILESKIKNRYRFKGRDENGKPIYEKLENNTYLYVTDLSVEKIMGD